MKVNTVDSQNFKGSVVRGFLGPEQEKIFNSVKDELTWQMRNSNFDLFISQERKWQHADFDRQVKLSLYNPYSTPKKMMDSIEVYEHIVEKWLEKFNELINRNK